MTPRERFEAWWSKSVMRHYDNTVGHLQMSASIAWQARDAEVKELVEALRECCDELRGFGELYDESIVLDLVAKADRILAKHEGDSR